MSKYTTDTGFVIKTLQKCVIFTEIQKILEILSRTMIRYCMYACRLKKKSASTLFGVGLKKKRLLVARYRFIKS